MNTSNYEVVRQEYVYTQEAPMLTMKAGRIYVNKFAIDLFPEYQFVQIMVDREKCDVVLQPVKQGVKDSFRWCGGKKRKSRKLKCLPVFYEIYKQMGWDIECRYRIQGRMEETDNEKALYFALKDAVCFRTIDDKEIKEFPKEWQYIFGDRKAEHKDGDYIARYDRDMTFSVELQMNKNNLNRMQDLAVSISENESKDEEAETAETEVGTLAAVGEGV